MKIPFISNVPILGKFFQSVSKTKQNSELMVIVTPELVQPVPEGTIAGPKFPVPFLPPNSTTPMHHPDGTGTAAGSPVQAPAVTTIPVEQLVQSMKQQDTLQDTGGTYSGSAPGGSGSGTAAPSTPQ
jgi:pilus assembly protein CpaC